MTRDDITRMAREAGSEAFKYPNLISETDWQIFERFAKLIRNDYSNKHAQLWLKRIDEAVKAEREEIAKMFDEPMRLVPFVQNHEGGGMICGFTPKRAAEVIRRRGKND